MTTQSARVQDENGYMLIRGCRISREGVYDYAAKQVYPQGHPNMGDPDRIIGVYRPESEIRDPESIESFKHIPFIDEHAMLAGDTSVAKYPDDISPEEHGVNGVLSDVYFDESDGWLKGDVKVWGREAQKNIREGKTDLSAGLNCRFKIGKGSFQGKEFEVTQINLRGNHLANVDEARVEGARILDARCFDSANLALTIETKEVEKMPKPINGRAADSALEQLKEMVPALQKIIAAAQEVNSDAPDSTDVDTSNAPAQVADDVETSEVPAEQSASESADQNADENQSDTASDVVDQAKSLLAEIQKLLSQSPSDDAAASEEVPVQDSTEDVPAKVMDEDEIVAKAEDAAVRRIRADEEKKGKLYPRLSNVIGSFDHRAMDSKSMAQYGLKKLKLTAEKGQEEIALDYYLNGMSAAQKKNAAEVVGRAADSKAQSAQLDQWLQEGAK